MTERTMVEDSITNVKGIIQQAYRVADELDRAGLKTAPKAFDSTRDAMQMDFQMLIFKIQLQEGLISDSCRRFLNVCLDQRYTPITVEMARLRVIESKICDMSLVLPYIILADVMGGKDFLADFYMQTISLFLIGYMKTETRLPIDMIVNYARVANFCMGMIEEAMGKRLDFDPMEGIRVKDIPFFNKALDVDKKIHADEWNGPFASQSLIDLVRAASDGGCEAEFAAEESEL